MCLALTPEAVQNLAATVDKHTPSVTLNWSPQGRSRNGDPVIAFDIRFKTEEEEDYSGTTVKGSATSIVVGKELGLKALVKYSFEVRARNAYIAGKWETVTVFVGKLKQCTV